MQALRIIAVTICIATLGCSPKNYPETGDGNTAKSPTETGMNVENPPQKATATGLNIPKSTSLIKSTNENTEEQSLTTETNSDQ